MTQQIDTYLNGLGVEIDSLPRLAERWNLQHDFTRADRALEWEESMDQLGVLEQCYRGGMMTPDQQAQYRLLLGKLKAHLPIIRRLFLKFPPVSLES